LKTAFLITARLKSTRLPGKILLPIKGKPLLVHMLDRIKYSQKIDKIIICTSINAQDDPLEDIAKEENIFCFRGSEDDVLSRLYNAALKYKLEFFVNKAADGPMVDPLFIDKAIKIYLKTNADFVTYNSLPGINVIKVSALEKICKIKQDSDTEVWRDYFVRPAVATKGISRYPFYVLMNPELDEKFKKDDKLRISLDYPEDYEFHKKVFDELYEKNNCFSLSDILDLIEKKPELLEINSNSSNRALSHLGYLK